jgi:hypothetical protein
MISSLGSYRGLLVFRPQQLYYCTHYSTLSGFAERHDGCKDPGTGRAWLLSDATCDTLALPSVGGDLGVVRNMAFPACSYTHCTIARFYSIAACLDASATSDEETNGRATMLWRWHRNVITVASQWPPINITIVPIALA